MSDNNCLQDRLYIINGENPLKMTLDLLQYLQPFRGLNKDTVFGIKPNLVCSSPANEGATTHPEIVEGIIIYLKSNGYDKIKIIEGSWVGDSTKRAFEICGYTSLAKKYEVELIDTKDDMPILKTYKNMDINICKSVLDIDYLINVPLIKGHCQTKITCALKNLKGLIPDAEKRRFHTRGLHEPIAYVNKLIKQDLIIADAICPDPYFEEGGSPSRLNKIVAGFDPVLMDSYAASILGYAANEIKYIEIAKKEGVGIPLTNQNQLVYINQNQAESKIEKLENKYLNIIAEADACSACYSNLVNALNKLHEEGLTDSFIESICIGQAYKGYKGELGIGDCTSSFKKHLAGCPPTTEEIMQFLKIIAGIKD